MSDKDNIPHGTASAYFNGCKCEECRAAGKAYRDEGTFDMFLAGKTRKPPLFHPSDRTTPFDDEDPRHGSLSAYTMGCRCPWCKLAGKAYREHQKLGLKLPKGWNARHQDEVGE